MEIEYAYSFSENVFYSGMGMLRFYFWLIPLAFLFSYHKRRRSLLKLVLALSTASGLFYWEYDSLNAKFATIAYDKSTVNLVQKSGHKVLLAPEAIERFWSISVGKHGGISCYLLVKTEDRHYESLIVRKRGHICEDDAKLLNAYYGKR